MATYFELAFVGENTWNSEWRVTRADAQVLITAWLDPETWAKAGEKMPHDAAVHVYWQYASTDDYGDRYEWASRVATYERDQALDFAPLDDDDPPATLNPESITIVGGVIYGSRAAADECAWCEGSGITWPDEEDPDQTTWTCPACRGTGRRSESQAGAHPGA